MRCLDGEKILGVLTYGGTGLSKPAEPARAFRNDPIVVVEAPLNFLIFNVVYQIELVFSVT
jgi:hypothetical protein